MSWIEFSSYYLLANFILVLSSYRLFRDRWALVVRAVTFSVLILMIGDALAEARGLWLIPKPFGPTVAGVPVENIFITTGTVLNSLAFFRITEVAFAARNS